MSLASILVSLARILVSLARIMVCLRLGYWCKVTASIQIAINDAQHNFDHIKLRLNILSIVLNVLQFDPLYNTNNEKYI